MAMLVVIKHKRKNLFWKVMTYLKLACPILISKSAVTKLVITLVRLKLAWGIQYISPNYKKCRTKIKETLKLWKKFQMHYGHCNSFMKDLRFTFSDRRKTA